MDSPGRTYLHPSQFPIGLRSPTQIRPASGIAGQSEASIYNLLSNPTLLATKHRLRYGVHHNFRARQEILLCSTQVSHAEDDGLQLISLRPPRSLGLDSNSLNYAGSGGVSAGKRRPVAEGSAPLLDYWKTAESCQSAEVTLRLVCTAYEDNQRRWKKLDSQSKIA